MCSQGILILPSDSKVTVFERDDVTGKLTFIDDHESAPEGVCVLF